MAALNFIPEVWADSLTDRWTEQSVLADLVTREFEGTASSGNVVHITGVVAPEIKDYKANGRISTPDDITDTGVDLLIDQEKEYAFFVDDIDRAQAAGSLDSYTDAAGDALVEDTNVAIAAALAAGGSILTGSTPTTGDEAFNLIRDARKQMNKNKVPAADRVILVNSEFEGLLLGANSKLTSFDTSGDAEGLRNATLGQLLNFRVVTSDALPESDTPAFAAFHPRAAAFVGQINKGETLRAQNKHADIVRGLHVYGTKVFRQNGVWVFGNGPGAGVGAADAWSLEVTGAPTGGTFTLSVNGVATAAIAYNASNTVIATALNALAGVSDVKVTGTGTKQIVFKTPALLTADAGALTGGTTPGVTVAKV